MPSCNLSRLMAEYMFRSDQRSKTYWDSLHNPLLDSLWDLDSCISGVSWWIFYTLYKFLASSNVCAAVIIQSKFHWKCNIAQDSISLPWPFHSKFRSLCIPPCRHHRIHDHTEGPLYRCTIQGRNNKFRILTRKVMRFWVILTSFPAKRHRLKG
jgi:hypothetical protein